MNCPPEIAEILLEILKQAALNIRLAAHKGDSEQCFQEADHIHNIPTILSSFSEENLKYYLKVERSIYLKRSKKGYPKFRLRKAGVTWKKLFSCEGILWWVQLEVRGKFEGHNTYRAFQRFHAPVNA